MDYFCGMIHDSRDFWVKAGNFESRCLREELEPLKIEKPIYVTGLARSGSSIILEILSRYEGLVSHCYRDFPPIFTPYWWNWFLRWALFKRTKPLERAHQDRIFVTPDSPEAMEEALWMFFFKDVHTIDKSDILDADTINPGFEAFYKDHIRKLLLVRNKNRYLAKANYNITRLEYLLKIFPDARFIIPIRRPVDQIKSLIKQHALFSKGQGEDPRALSYLEKIGHFEFGLDFRPINTGDASKTVEILDLLADNKNITAWSRYWNQIYGFIANRLTDNKALEKAVMIVDYGEFCESPGQTIEMMRAHCDLPDNSKIIFEYKEKIKPPDYYTMDFTPKELTIIQDETQKTRELIKAIQINSSCRQQHN